ncbi:histidyl-tRNA synthetase [Nematocida major]|uniref:histidyl-tRNA synthetase n=1 Tax=Nematocida major TaxID=1912982 RepID=UPI002007D107|nr:histidyl-tRNA synthetase [Nematocida major]KAH9385833.1 histidyl-tRNA synthetase [Nematocida major]
MDKAVKTPKGTRDYVGSDKIKLDRIIEQAEKVYKSMGGIPFDTPSFEIKSTLTQKYGEESKKLIYDLADQGGEICALKYDLTVPLARFLAMTKTQKIKRFHTDKVYRRDQPALNRGRYREFYQSDFDIVGEYSHMAADAEIVFSACEILRAFSGEISRDILVRINHRKLVDGIMSLCGIESEIRRDICSSIDKLDKIPWEDVALEMQSKGASSESIQEIRKFTLVKGSIQEVIRGIPELARAESEAVHDLMRLDELLSLYGVGESVVLDLSLIRGLEYYTGLLIEGGYVGLEGSFVAGGRYDGLADAMGAKREKKSSKPKESNCQQMDSSSKNTNNKSTCNCQESNCQKMDGCNSSCNPDDTAVEALCDGVKNLKCTKTPEKCRVLNTSSSSVKCVGMSLGVSRLFSALEGPERKTYTEVLVCSVGSNLLSERVRMCLLLRRSGINAEYFMGESNNFARHSEYAESAGIGTLVLIGRKEIETETYQIISGERNSRKKVPVHIDRIAEYIKGMREPKNE